MLNFANYLYGIVIVFYKVFYYTKTIFNIYKYMYIKFDYIKISII